MTDLVRQIECVERELRIRRGVYPGMVAVGRMSAAKAAREIEDMEAVLATLRGLSPASATLPGIPERRERN